MKKYLIYILPALFFSCFILALIGTTVMRPRVLVVMSYSIEDPWEERIRAGIDDTFKKEASYFRVNYYYLNVRDNHETSYVARVLQNANALITAWRPQVIILVDDDAQSYVGRDYLNKANLGLVFTGVNANPAIYGYQPHQNVTGIVENLHFDAMQDAIKTMFPRYTKIIHLCDDSTTSKIISPQISENNWRPLHFLGSYPVHSLDEWFSVVKKANQQHALLLLTHFQTIQDHGEPVAATRLMEMTLQQARVPIVSFFNFDTSLGAPMAISTSGFEQGQVAAQMAIRILDHKENPGNMPFVTSRYFDFSLNQNSIERNMPWVNIPLIYRSLAYLKTTN